MHPDKPLTVSRLVAPVWARRGLVLVCLAVGLLLGLLASTLLPKSYAATSVVTVAPVTVNPFGTAQGTQAVNMESERSAITSSSVVTRAAATLRGVDVETLADALSVSVPSESLVLKVTATTADPATSAAWANAVAKAYLDDRTDAANDAANRIIARLQTDVDERVRLRNSLPASDRVQADQELAALRDRVSALTTVGLNPGRIITPAAPPARPASLGRLALGAAGLALGLLTGIALAVFRDRTSPTVDSATWLATATGAEVQAAGRDVTAASAAVAERALTLRPRGAARCTVLDLCGAGSGPLVQALQSQAAELGLPTDARRVQPGGPPPRGPGAATILDLSAPPRPTSAAALLEPGDVALLQVDVDTPRAEVEAVRDVIAAQAAEIGGILYLQDSRPGAGKSKRRRELPPRGGPAHDATPVTSTPAVPEGSRR